MRRLVAFIALSLGGIPFVAGFWAKVYVFWAAAQQGLYRLVLVGAILTVVALFYYLLVAKRMYIDAPDTPAPVTAPFLLNLDLPLRGRRGRLRGVPEAARHGRPPRRAELVLNSQLIRRPHEGRQRPRASTCSRRGPAHRPVRPRQPSNCTP